MLLIVALFHSCETIYDYHLSYSYSSGGTSFHNALGNMVPTAINAHKGTVANHIEIIFQSFDEYEALLADSLRNDIRPVTDSALLITITITAIDPYGVETKRDYEHTYVISQYP
ncbi:MAG TPA: hypothetical protein PLM49_00750 [Bacteroidales bacterium]|nr:hypothetical protein [Bacteroidales bacterium]